MSMQSTSVATTTFKIVKKGYDPDEVRAYLKEVGGALQAAQEHAAQVEAKARQAITRAREEASAQVQAAAVPLRTAKLDDTETISRTLLLAQKTADETVAAAEAEATSLRSSAQAEAAALLAQARDEVSRASDSARAEARKAGESERQKVESELQQLLARLEFLRDDVTQMEAHTAHQRERLLQVADDLQAIATRPTAGLGESRRPVLSAAADLDADGLTATQAVPVVPAPPADEPVSEPVADTEGTGEPAPMAIAEPVEASPALDPVEQLFPSDDRDDHHDLDITAEVPIVE